MLTTRLSEIAQKPEAPLMYAQAADDNFFIAKTKDAYTLIGLAKEGMTLETFKTLLTEAQRVNLHGFTASEFDRAKADIKTNYENMYNERSKRKTSVLDEFFKRNK